MKILTLNTWQERGPWRERWELIFHGLREYDADIVAFQEVFNMEWAQEVRERAGYSYLAMSGEHSGLVFLSRFKPCGQECLVYKTTSPNEDYLRYVFFVRVETPQGPIALFNTHLSWKAEDSAVRMNQVFELTEFVQRKAGEFPAAVMGDFNTAPDTMPMVFLRNSRKWVDTYAIANPENAGLTWNYKNPYAEVERDKMAERRIDCIYITALKGVFSKVMSSKVVFDSPKGGHVYFPGSQNEASLHDIWPSDHFGVMTEFGSQK